jgi:hypothetical protein
MVPSVSLLESCPSSLEVEMRGVMRDRSGLKWIFIQPMFGEGGRE